MRIQAGLQHSHLPQIFIGLTNPQPALVFLLLMQHKNMGSPRTKLAMSSIQHSLANQIQAITGLANHIFSTIQSSTIYETWQNQLQSKAGNKQELKGVNEFYTLRYLMKQCTSHTL